jgi:RNA polymerase-binding transcription factor DksA
LITVDRREELDAVLARLEAEYEAHTERLGRLMARRRDRRTAVYNLAEIASCRKALARTARVLQRMADRDFGRCSGCSTDIPVDRLVSAPDLRYCDSCAAAVPA